VPFNVPPKTFCRWQSKQGRNTADRKANVRPRTIGDFSFCTKESSCSCYILRTAASTDTTGPLTCHFGFRSRTLCHCISLNPALCPLPLAPCHSCVYSGGLCTRFAVFQREDPLTRFSSGAPPGHLLFIKFPPLSPSPSTPAIHVFLLVLLPCCIVEAILCLFPVWQSLT